MSTISDKLLRLNEIRNSIVAATQKKGIDTAGSTFENIHELWPSTPSDFYQEKIVIPDSTDVIVNPDDGYIGLKNINIPAELNIQPWNIRKGKTIFGITGTAEIEVTSEVPPDLPVQPEDAEEEYENQFGEPIPEDMMVLADDNGNIIYGYFQRGGTLYNGVELPMAPEYDDEEYSGSYIVRDSDGQYFWIAAWSGFRYDYIDDGETEKGYCLVGGSYSEYLISRLVNNEWTEPELVAVDSSAGDEFPWYPEMIWSDVDILNDDDTLHFDATKPVVTGKQSFTITSYDPVTTNFTAIGWRRLSWHTAGEKAGTWSDDDFTSKESEGEDFLKNIISCTRDKLYYKGVEVWPTNWPTWDSATHPYAVLWLNPDGEPLLAVMTSPALVSSVGIVGGFTSGFRFRYSAGAWVSEGSITVVMITPSQGETLVWSNHDILNEDGTLYFPSSV